MPSDEARRAREDAEQARDDAEQAAADAATKIAEAVRAIERLRRHGHTDSFVDLVRQALGGRP